jgi:hypothetical protein
MAKEGLALWRKKGLPLNENRLSHGETRYALRQWLISQK